MPRAFDMSTRNIQKQLVKAISDVRDGTIDTKTGNTMISGYKAIMYGNQLQAGEERLEVDRRLAENMEALNEYIRNGGTLPDLQEVENHEKAELQGIESVSGGLQESQ
jgi:hypothetical protein